MGMTLWIHTLQGRNMSKESDDHSMMNEYAEALDKVCKQLGVPLLSSFFDTTDLEYNFSDDEDDELEEPQIDPETELAYGIDDMKWFDAANGIRTLSALRSHVKDKGQPRLDDEERQMLIEELDDCLAKLEMARSGKFHLAVIS